ncbi:RHS repeat-associated core domain-containing protein, partial [Neisseria animaloris]|uniref:RHS repeat-associated core domain-containing protein n=1 Tax=Neisseria animaloris TaxID=326522 RepID=UPI0039E1BA27
LVAESGFDHKLTAYHYNAGNELVQQNEYGTLDIPAEKNLSDGLKDHAALIVSEYGLDNLGRLKHILARHTDGSIGQRTYHYDSNGNLVRAAIPNHSTAFDYNPNGGIIGEYALKLPTAQECTALALPELDWQIPEHDMFLLGKSADIRYFYDANGNRTVTELPDGQRIHHLYYGSGHLHSIMLDDTVIADIERDKLHREIQRTQGALTSRYELDPVGRLKKQIAQLNSLSERGTGKTKAIAGYAVKRSYGYDKTGNLIHSTDQRSGTVHYEYDPLGQIKKAGSSLFAFDPAHNIIDSYERKVHDNRLAEYGGAKFFYDAFGNTVHKEFADGETQNLYYDVFHQLVKVETFKHNPETGEWAKETWLFDYDALGRRISKGRLKNGGQISDGLEDVTEFIWSGSRLVQEVYGNGRYTYIHTDQDSYEPLAQIHSYTDTEGKSRQEINYFHCDQIGIPREMTDRDGNLIWFGKYDAWGKLTKETNVTGRAHQPFRLQNQYCDSEIRLHYNFFRYYDPDVGRFVNQDPIGLWGGDNFYSFAPNTTAWVDWLGWIIVYRALNSSEIADVIAGKGISRPTPAHKTTPTQHISGTKHSRDPWISTTRCEKTAKEKYAPNDDGTSSPVIRIDTDKIPKENILDVSTPEKASSLGTPFARNAAAADQEVLIKGNIPATAITLLT